MKAEIILEQFCFTCNHGTIDNYLIRCHGNHWSFGNFVYTSCIYDISIDKIKFLDPKNVENDTLRATFECVVDAIAN